MLKEEYPLSGRACQGLRLKDREDLPAPENGRDGRSANGSHEIFGSLHQPGFFKVLDGTGVEGR
jgi:hypothetical protein